MTDGIIERAARAIDIELQRQHEHGSLGYYLPRENGDDWNTVDGNIDVTPIVRAVLQAIREPSEAMLKAMRDEVPLIDDPDHLTRQEYVEYWQAMIDAALET